GNSTSAFVGGTPNNVDLAVPITVQDITLGTGTNGQIYNITDFGGGSLTIQGNVTKVATGGALQFLLVSNALTLAAGDHVFALADTPGDAAELSINGVITGPGNVVLDNGSSNPSWGTLVFNTPNTYTGNTTINKGRLVMTTNGALGTGAVTVGSIGTLSIGGAGTTVTSGLTITQPITIKRDPHSGGESGSYPYAINVNNNGTAQTHTISGPLVVD